MKRQRKKYQRPSHPWEKERMDAEDQLLRKFGLRRKREIWRTQTILRNFRRQARNLLAASGPQAMLETRQLLERLRRLGLVGENATLDDVLGLDVEKLLERRLQTIVHRKGLARTQREARQLVVHGHIKIGDRRVNVPSHLVTVDEENMISCTRAAPTGGGEPHPEKTEAVESTPETGAGEGEVS
ncbi:MAG: 30S ribosomal protein S4 [Candidatus Hadarchaeales archaeon]